MEEKMVAVKYRKEKLVDNIYVYIFEEVIENVIDYIVENDMIYYVKEGQEKAKIGY